MKQGAPMPRRGTRYDDTRALDRLALQLLRSDQSLSLAAAYRAAFKEADMKTSCK